MYPPFTLARRTVKTDGPPNAYAYTYVKQAGSPTLALQGDLKVSSARFKLAFGCSRRSLLLVRFNMNATNQFFSDNVYGKTFYVERLNSLCVSNLQHNFSITSLIVTDKQTNKLRISEWKQEINQTH
jgi:hypothetical protein